MIRCGARLSWTVRLQNLGRKDLGRESVTRTHWRHRWRLDRLGYGHAVAWFQLRSSRAFDLRQSVYIEAAVSMAKGLEFFGSVTRLDSDDAQLAALINPTSAAMYKIHVVATPATIAALSNANLNLTLAMLDLMKRRALLRSAIAAIDQSDTLAAANVGRLRKDLLVEATNANLRYQRELVEVNIAARRELGLKLDEVEYRGQNRKAEAAITTAIDQTIRESDALQPNPALEPTARN
jgi:hypothetical protein